MSSSVLAPPQMMTMRTLMATFPDARRALACHGVLLTSADEQRTLGEVCHDFRCDLEGLVADLVRGLGDYATRDEVEPT